MKLHLVDGTYELFRAFYAMPSLKGPDGTEVAATRQLMRSLASMLRDPEVTHVGVAFDTVIESFRNELFDGYKTGEGIDPALWAQFPLAEEATRALGLVAWSMIEFEADDGICAAAARWRDDVDQVVICTPDKDLCQCVRDRHVVVLDRRREIVLDEEGVKGKFGVPPTSIPDYLALVGDSADGIPGIPRWGAKSAAQVLARYGHLEDIPPVPTKWDVQVRGAKTLSANLEEMREEAELYRTLATLREDVPLEESLEDLEWKGPSDELEPFCERIGENTVLERIDEALG